MRLTGKVAGVSMALNGRPLITFEFEDRAALDAAGLTDERMTIELKKYKEKRSLDANAYAWVLMGRLAEVLGKPREEIYRSYVKEVGAFEYVCVQEKAAKSLREGWERNGLGWVTEEIPSKIPRCRTVILHYGSSTYDSAQMSKLLDLIIEDCKAQGIETDTPEELQRLKEGWK